MTSRNTNILGAALALACGAWLAGAQAMSAQHPAAPAHIMVDPAEIEWKQGPASLPRGAEYALIEGDWTKEGPFTARLRLPANYRIPPHHHPAIEHVTVLQGSFYMGLGEDFVEAKARRLPVGGFAVMQIGTRHFAFTREPSIIQLHGVGPWGITYVRPDDDPRRTQ